MAVDLNPRTGYPVTRFRVKDRFGASKRTRVPMSDALRASDVAKFGPLSGCSRARPLAGRELGKDLTMPVYLWQRSPSVVLLHGRESGSEQGFDDGAYGVEPAAYGLSMGVAVVDAFEDHGQFVVS